MITIKSPPLRQITMAAAVVALATTFSCQSAVALDSTSDWGRIDRISKKVKTDGKVRVIARLQVGTFIPEGRASQTHASKQRGMIRNARSNVVGVLRSVSPGFNTARVKTYDSVPFVAMEVDSAELDTLIANADVADVMLDDLHTLSLASSIPRIDGDDAWNLGYSGTDQTVAVLDTGVKKDHQFLTGKVVSEACYSSNLCPGGVRQSTASGSGVNCSTSISSSCSHGTHVAGIATGKGSSFSGVAKDANIIAIQVFSSVSGGISAYTSDIMLGLERVYALRNTYNIASVNMSLGGGLYSNNCDTSSLKPIIDTLRAAGIATVVATGNDGSTSKISHPACISSTVSVGSTMDSDAVSSFSNVSSTTDLFAPGSSITSSVADSTSAYATWNGTSMATPHVAGAFAVLKSKKPSATVDELENALKSRGFLVQDQRFGGTVVVSRIDIDDALAALGGGSTDTTPDDFNFTAQTGVQLSQWIESNSATITGIDVAVSISVSNGQYRINGGTYTSEPGTISAGQTLQIRHQSAANSLTTVTTTATVGTVSRDFSSTTLQASTSPDSTPDPFSFNSISRAQLLAIQESNTVTITGINVPVNISVQNGEYRINGGSYQSLTGTINNGDTIQVRHVSSSRRRGTVTTTLTIGNVSATFTSRTR